GVAEDTEMSRDPRLLDRDACDEVVHRALAGSQGLDDLAAHGVGQDFEGVSMHGSIYTRQRILCQIGPMSGSRRLPRAPNAGTSHKLSADDPTSGIPIPARLRARPWLFDPARYGRDQRRRLSDSVRAAHGRADGRIRGGHGFRSGHGMLV